MASILLIEDDPDIRSLLGDILELAGHQVTATGDGSIGIARYRGSPADLVITDIFMPGKEGIEIIRELRQIDPQVKIIAISGGGARGRLDVLDSAQIFGAARALEKPFAPETLLATIREVLGVS